MMTGPNEPLSLDFAILAPVPLAHLTSGVQIARDHAFVAFGSMKWEFFQLLDARRGHQPVPVLLYPSHEEISAEPGCIVSWFGWYRGHLRSRGGAHPDGMKHRPPTTAANPDDNKGYWAVFWHVSGLRELPRERHLRIGDLQTVKGGWRKNKPPRGPELVATPPELGGEP